MFSLSNAHLNLQLRVLYVLQASRLQPPALGNKPKTKSSHVVIVLGSGGHTAEMMSLLRDIDTTRYTHRTYIVSSEDNFSSSKAKEIEKVIEEKQIRAKPHHGSGTWDLKTVPRARKIHQSLYTTPFSALWCLLGCIYSLYKTSRSSTVALNEYPDVIITNGPATAVMVIIAANILKFVGVAPIWKMKIIYVESWARVKTLSLSGKILLYAGICDRFLVQWEALATTVNGNGGRKRVEWVGFLVE